MAPLAFLLAATVLTVHQADTPLRTGCETHDETVATLPRGAAVTVRFAINGCFAVQYGQLQGYLPAAALEGREHWDAERQQAPTLTTATIPPTSALHAPPALTGIAQKLNENRPAEALQLLESALVRSPRDPGLLAGAGLAAHRAGFTLRAIGYWKDSLSLRPDPAVSALLARAEREAATEQGTRLLESTRFSLRYDPALLSDADAREISQLLEQEFARIAFELGCQPPERIAATAQSRQAYLQATGAAEWSGGLFDGRIRVAVLDPATMRKSFAHELVHACVAATGRWPAWLHEGLAQRLTGEATSSPLRRAITTAAQAGQIPPLQQMDANWAHLSPQHAHRAYATALYAVELFYTHHKEFGIRNLLRNPEYLDRIAADLDTLLRK